VGVKVKIGERGLTLIELLIVVVIIAIIASFAYPAYQSNKVKVSRNEAKSEMLFVVQRMQAYKATNGNYLGATINQLYGANTLPKSGGANYTLAFQAAPTASTWTLVATPVTTGPQAQDGVLCIDHQNRTFWSKGENACALTETSNWN
jgi:type IV pilus assembly protein PilE